MRLGLYLFQPMLLIKQTMPFKQYCKREFSLSIWNRPRKQQGIKTLLSAYNVWSGIPPSSNDYSDNRMTSGIPWLISVAQ